MYGRLCHRCLAAWVVPGLVIVEDDSPNQAVLGNDSPNQLSVGKLSQEIRRRVDKSPRGKQGLIKIELKT